MSDPDPACPICLAQGALAAQRHVAAWGELTAAEQFSLLAQLGEALEAGASGFVLAVEHGHLRLRETPAPPPEPHAIQRAALAALAATRAGGHRAGLVVLATGLGKTWLAAFDRRSADRWSCRRAVR